MSSHDIDDRLLLELGRLPLYQPDAARSERVRSRCAATLTRRQAKKGRPAADSRLPLESTFVAGLCLAYVVGMILDVLQLRGSH